jgi:hypothetical protein
LWVCGCGGRGDGYEKIGVCCGLIFTLSLSG